MSFENSFAYADDTFLFCEATSVPEVLEKSHTLLKDASQWYNSHLLKLNLQKTQFCVFSDGTLKDYYHLNLQHTKIESQLSINVLGVALDTDLSFITHATDVATRANNFVYLISKLKKFMNVEESLKTYKIIVRRILEYCSAIYLDTTQKVIETIEKVQKQSGLLYLLKKNFLSQLVEGC